MGSDSKLNLDIQTLGSHIHDIHAKWHQLTRGVEWRDLTASTDRRGPIVFRGGKRLRSMVMQYLREELKLSVTESPYPGAPVDLWAIDDSGYGFFQIPHMILLRVDRSFSPGEGRELSREEEEKLLAFASLVWHEMRDQFQSTGGENLALVVSIGYLNGYIAEDGELIGFSYYIGSAYDPALDEHFSRLQSNFARMYERIYEGLLRRPSR